MQAACVWTCAIRDLGSHRNTCRICLSRSLRHAPIALDWACSAHRGSWRRTGERSRSAAAGDGAPASQYGCRQTISRPRWRKTIRRADSVRPQKVKVHPHRSCCCSYRRCRYAIHGRISEMARLGELLDKLHRMQFVGRENEISLFCRALCAERLPFAVLYVHGAGGIGKTLLLKRYLACCIESGIPSATMDCRNIEPTVSGLEQALNAVIMPMQSLSADGGTAGTARQVLFLDSYDAVIALDSWLRDVFMPQLPEEILVVIAGREAVPLGWRADIGWQTLCTILPLGYLDPQESRSYLIGRTVPVRNHQDILKFANNHPLALALAADRFAQCPSVDFAAGAPLDVVHSLLNQFLRDLPGPVHRDALESCAAVPVLTEPLLAQMIGASEGDVAGLFEWLRPLSFIDANPIGLIMHDIMREVLMADLRWRNPARCTQLRERARLCTLQSLQEEATPDSVSPPYMGETVGATGRPGYDLAVKNALRVYACPERLRGNPLLHSRLITNRAGWERDVLCRIEALRTLIQEVAARTFMSPRDAKLYRALELACFSPMPSQEKAAERMDVSFATFRRYLKAAIERLTEALWQREISSERK